MSYLPLEIIGHIWSFREKNPIALLIQKSIDDYEGKIHRCKLHCYYFHTLMSRKIRILTSKVNKKWDKCNDFKKIRKQMEDDFKLEIENIQKGVKELKIDTLPIELQQPIKDEINQCYNEKNKEYLKSILPYDTEITKLNEEVWNERRERSNFRDYVYDINRSIICSGIIRPRFFKYIRTEYCLFYDKYRSEIYSVSPRKNYRTKKMNKIVYYPHLL